MHHDNGLHSHYNKTTINGLFINVINLSVWTLSPILNASNFFGIDSSVYTLAPKMADKWACQVLHIMKRVSMLS